MPLQRCNRGLCTVLQGGGRCKVHLCESACVCVKQCVTEQHIVFTCACTLTQMNFAPLPAALYCSTVRSSLWQWNFCLEIEPRESSNSRSRDFWVATSRLPKKLESCNTSCHESCHPSRVAIVITFLWNVALLQPLEVYCMKTWCHQMRARKASMLFNDLFILSFHCTKMRRNEVYYWSLHPVLFVEQLIVSFFTEDIIRSWIIIMLTLVSAIVTEVFIPPLSICCHNRIHVLWCMQPSLQ